jgi:hypothetical protein
MIPDWVSFLAYPIYLGLKTFVAVVVAAQVTTVYIHMSCEKFTGRKLGQHMA